MGLDEELEAMEDGALTEAEQVDEEADVEQVEDFLEDEEFSPDAGEEDVEEAYEGFLSADGNGEEEDAPAAEAEEELYEIEVDDDDIAYYIEDEDGNEIGFALIENGVETEYYYVDEEDACDCGCGGNHAAAEEDNEFDMGITREGVANATNDMNAIYKDGIAMAAEFKGAFDDIKSALDFTDILKKPGK